MKGVSLGVEDRFSKGSVGYVRDFVLLPMRWETTAGLSAVMWRGLAHPCTGDRVENILGIN